jgi:hypothetical protein
VVVAELRRVAVGREDTEGGVNERVEVTVFELEISHLALWAGAEVPMAMVMVMAGGLLAEVVLPTTRQLKGSHRTARVMKIVTISLSASVQTLSAPRNR